MSIHTFIAVVIRNIAEIDVVSLNDNRSLQSDFHEGLTVNEHASLISHEEELSSLKMDHLFFSYMVIISRVHEGF